MKRLVLFSNSRDAEGRYLHHASDAIARACRDVHTALFIPYADVSGKHDEYRDRAQSGFDSCGVILESIHRTASPKLALETASAIVVGGGNTFHLLRALQQHGLLDAIRTRVARGVPYIGWSAGSVVACPTLGTTNDMPIVEPASFAALSLVSFQINAHFTDAHPPGFQGETRRQRIGEFVTANPGMPVIGLPEGDWLEVNDDEIRLEGLHPAPLFRFGAEPRDLHPGSEIHAWLAPLTRENH